MWNLKEDYLKEDNQDSAKQAKIYANNLIER